MLALGISVCPVSVVPPVLHTQHRLDITLTRRTKAGSLVPRNILCSEEYLIAMGRREASHCPSLHKYLIAIAKTTKISQ
jgi:hypothetical protein